MKFSITGANGFLGVHLIHHLLKNKHSVQAIIRSGASKKEFKLVKGFYQLPEEDYSALEWMECSLEDTPQLREIVHLSDYVIHLAGFISYRKKDLNQLIKVNAEYTGSVVNACLNTDVKKLIHCSSISAISKAENQINVDETAQWDRKLPHSLYGFSKHLSEHEVYRGSKEGLGMAIINPGIVLGYGDFNKGSNSIFKNAYNNFPFYSEGSTGFVGVEDVCSICLQLCLAPIKNERFIVISENLSFKKVLFSMANHLGKKKPSINVRGVLYRLIYGFVSLKEILGISGLLTRETVKASVSKSSFSNQKIKDVLNYDFQPIDQVIKKASEGYKKSPPK